MTNPIYNPDTGKCIVPCKFGCGEMLETHRPNQARRCSACRAKYMRQRYAINKKKQHESVVAHLNAKVVT